ncbi:MAG TPA: hypothetical protein VF875_14190 [Anaeromyxobacter sp.]
MAVKVMVAPAIVNGEIEKQEPVRRREPTAAKPKRRRSSIYDADGNEVFITLMCLKCHRMRPLSQFGLRKMADGAIRNQPWCRPCRSASGADKPRRKESAEIVESVAANPSPPAAQPEAAPISASPPTFRPASTVAAEVAAALAAGLRR